MNPLLRLSLSLSLCAPALAQQSLDLKGEVGASNLAIPFDRLSYDTPGDGSLWVRGATYKASFGADGATYIPFLGSKAPRNYPLHMQLSAASLGELDLKLTDSATWTRSGDTVTLERGEVDVRYHLGLERIEQTFLIDRLPATGDLVVRVAVDSELSGSQTASGFRFSGERGGVDYGTATVLDAGGRSLAVESRLEGGDITIRVPDAFLRSAQLPVVVDPFISTYAINGTQVDTWVGDMAFDATHQRFLHAYTYDFSQDDSDVYSITVDKTGAPIWADGAWVDMTSTYWANVSVANNNDANTFLVVSGVTINDVTSVWSRCRFLPGTSMGVQRKLSTSTNFCGTASVGGDGNPGAGSLYCVAWGETLGGGPESVINYRMVNGNGTTASSVHSIADSRNTLQPSVNVSESNGNAALFYRAWNLVWDKQPDNLSSNVYGAQIAFNGNVLTPSFPVDTTPTNHFQPKVSSPLNSAAGGAPDFLVVYGGSGDVHARLFKRDKYLGSFDLTGIEADVLGQGHVLREQAHPTVATDGDQFIVAYGESSGEFGDDEVYISSFANVGGQLLLTEAHTLMSAGEGSHMFPRISSAAEAGDAGSRVIGMCWLGTTYIGQSADWDTEGGMYSSPDGWVNVGTPLCPGTTNSTGSKATFRAMGYSQPTPSHLFLDVDNLPTFSWGQFLMSQTQASIPVGNGTLCLGGPQIRLSSTFANSWTQGAVGSQLDLASLPPGIAVLAGQSWNFQFWYRDAGSSNFSNAVTVQF